VGGHNQPGAVAPTGTSVAVGADPLGFDERGEQVTLELVGRNMLISGIVGAGSRICSSRPEGQRRRARGRHRSVGVHQGADGGPPGRVAEAGVRKAGRGRWPLELLVVDEVQEFTATGDKRCEYFAGLLRRIVTPGRAADVIVVVSTERPSVDVLPSSLRDLFEVRCALPLRHAGSVEQDPFA
jgi:hypothetical protein